LSLLGLVFIWIFCIAEYAKLPEIIPTHFNVQGEADDHGSKASIFILPAIISLVYILLTILNKYPHLFNYPQTITADNAKEAYTKATQLLRIIKLIIIVFTVIIMLDMVRSAKDGHSKLTWWIIPVFILAMIIPVIISVKSAFKKAPNDSK
jgi:uncharacterized membrane protein